VKKNIKRCKSCPKVVPTFGDSAQVWSLSNRRARLSILGGVHVRGGHELPHGESWVPDDWHHHLVASKWSPLPLCSKGGRDHRWWRHEAWAGIQEFDLLLEVLLLCLQLLLLITKLVLLSLNKDEVTKLMEFLPKKVRM